MKEKPILFSGPMIRSLLAGTKTVTRRVVKPETYGGESGLQFEFPGWHGSLGAKRFADEYCNFGKVGDRLWVRETWQQVYPVRNGQWHTASNVKEGFGKILYAADTDRDEPPKWRPSIFMPRWASRITLEIVGVRCERLQEITEAEAQQEGLSPTMLSVDEMLTNHAAYSTVASFRELWDGLNGKKFPWQSNPWVFVISFKRIKT